MADGAQARYLPLFRQDLRITLTWSHRQFGPAAAGRYAALIRQALSDSLEDPFRPGSKPRPELAPRAFAYHLFFSRDRVAGERVKSPRHFVLYRYAGERIEFARLLHDSRDLARHLPSGYRGT